MSVKSVLKRYFDARVAAGSRITVTVVMLGILFITSAFTTHPDRDLRVKELNVIIRQVGHRLLLQAGDSTSRILPVTETDEGTFQLRFEDELVFNHDSLLALSQGLLPKIQFPSGYTVTVHDGLNDDIVYAFRLSNTSQDLLPCRGRRQSSGYYVIEFTFPDLYKDEATVEGGIEEDFHIEEPANVLNSPKVAASETTIGKIGPAKIDERKGDARQVIVRKIASCKGCAQDLVVRETTGREVAVPAAGTPKIYPQGQNARVNAIKLMTIGDNAHLLTVKPDSSNADTNNAVIGNSVVVERAAPEKEELKVTEIDHSLVHFLYSGALVLLSVTLLLGRFWRVPEQMKATVMNRNHPVEKAPVHVMEHPVEATPQFCSLGKFQFDVRRQRLLLGSEVLSLTDKECRILELLRQNFDVLVLRETLMQKVWIDDGVITGRSLDVFVSKLRRKLSSDPSLRITNVHGKGYRLEVTEA